jgi:hypothetical protein
MTLPFGPFVCKNIDVEAGAEGLFNSEGVMPNNEFDIDPLVWADVDEIVKRDYRQRAHAAVAAALGEVIPAEVETHYATDGSAFTERIVGPWQPVVSDKE